MSYSHPATKQDLWVLENSEGPGSFIELGAYDGLRHSNTLFLEEKGWRGQLIEAHRPYYEECVVNRPLARVHHAAVGPERATELVIGGQYTGLVDRMPAAWLAEHKERCNPRIPVVTTPLHRVVTDIYVDYLSVDTEGGEYDILEEWFRLGFRCRLLTVEFRFNELEARKLEELADAYCMDLMEIRGFDLCFKSALKWGK